jgi:hypothetical protein
MHILRHPDETATLLVERFAASDLIYGTGETYPSLVTPSATVLSCDEVAALEADLPLLWGLYRTWHTLYRASLSGEEPAWIARLCEQGLTPAEIEAQRVTLAAGLEPQMCRVDYIAIGKRRAIAEVQWKSGGLGLFFGTRDVCTTIDPEAAAPLGNPTERLRELILRCGRGGEPVAVNGVRAVWFRGEHYLRRAYDRCGMRYIVFDRRESARRLIERGGTFFVAEGGALLRVDFLYAQEMLPALAPATIVRLAQTAAAGGVWIETPLSYVYRQKWGMALPFMPAYAHLFDNQLRTLIGPTALLHTNNIDIRVLAEGLPAAVGEQLRAVKHLDDIASLPTAARRALVLKCGGGSGAYYSQGRGVMRLNGSHAVAQGVIAFVRERLALGEPWMLQQYVDVTYPVEIAPPWQPQQLERIDAHARLMVYGALDATGAPQVIGGLGNYSSAWKVSGKTATLDERGRLTGAAFNDLRVEHSRCRI